MTPGAYAAALKDMPPLAADQAADPAGYKLEKASARLNAGYACEARKLLREVIAE